MKKVLTTLAVGVFALGLSVLVNSLQPQQASAASCTSRLFASGSRSVCVKYIQQILNAEIYFSQTPAACNGAFYHQGSSLLAADSIYGPKTRSEVIKFQKGRCLKSDGIVGQQTWRSLCQAGLSRAYAWAEPYAVTATQAARNAGC